MSRHIAWPTPLSRDGERRLIRLKDILMNESDPDFVDALTDLVTSLIDDGAFLDALERPYFVRDICQEAADRLSQRG